MNRAVFLDRDGTLIAEKNYLHRPEDVEIFPGVGGALKKLADAGFKLFVVTNQSGIGRGYFSLADAERVNEHVNRELARGGGQVRQRRDRGRPEPRGGLDFEWQVTRRLR